jgi:hypothetical protein
MNSDNTTSTSKLELARLKPGETEGINHDNSYHLPSTQHRFSDSNNKL